MESMEVAADSVGAKTERVTLEFPVEPVSVDKGYSNKLRSEFSKNKNQRFSGLQH